MNRFRFSFAVVLDFVQQSRRSFIGALFVIVVMFLPKGLAGILDYFRGRTKVER